MLILEATAADFPSIRTVLEDAFPGDDEARLVELLRTQDDVFLELVAEEKGEIIGEVMLSPMRSPNRTLGLGPIAISKNCQRQGIGSALMKAAIEAAKAHNWAAIILLGNPAYYSRFGFSADAAGIFETPYPKEYFQVLELEEGFLKSCDRRAAYAAAFEQL